MAGAIVASRSKTVDQRPAAPAARQTSAPQQQNQRAADAFDPNQAARQRQIQQDNDARARELYERSQQSAPQQTTIYQGAPAAAPAAPAPATPAPAAQGPAVQALQRADAGAMEGWQATSTPGETRPGLGDRLPIARPQLFGGNRIY